MPVIVTHYILILHLTCLHTYVHYRVSGSAYIKSIKFKGELTTKEEDYPSYQKIGKKVNFIGVDYNVGCTSYSNRAHMGNVHMQKSFGSPQFFFRFSLTSAIQNVPYSHVHWCTFRAVKLTVTVRGS